MKRKIFLFCLIVFVLNVVFSVGVLASEVEKIVVKNGKYHVIRYGRYILKNYDFIKKINNSKEDFYFVKLNGKYGIVYRDSTVILKPIYDSIENAGNRYFIVRINGKLGLYNFYDNKWEIVPSLDKIYLTTNNYYIARRNNKYGIYSGDKQDWALDLSYDIIDFANNNFYVRQYGYDGILNQFLEVVIPLVYDEIEFDEDRNIYYVMQNNLWGVTDLYGNYILKPIYQDISEIFYNSKFVGYIAKFNSKYGIIDEDNKLVAWHVYDKIERISEYDDEFLKVKRNDKFGVLRYDGKSILRCKLDDIDILKSSNDEDFDNDLQVYKTKEMQYVFVYPFENQLGVYDINGKELIFPNYQEIYKYFYNKDVRAFVVKRNNRYGVVYVKDGVQTFKYINKTLDEVITDVKTEIVKQNPLFKP